MARQDRLAAEVFVTAEVSAEAEQAIVEEFGALGVAARARMVPVRRGSDELQWLLLAVLPLQAFLSTLGSTFADEASQALKRLVGRAHKARKETATPRPILVLQDAETRLQVVLEADLPADAYKALLSLDLSKFHEGPLHYDWHRGTWRSELDELHHGDSSPGDQPYRG